MKIVRKNLKPVSIGLAIFVLMISGPFQAAHAALIGTETVLDGLRAQEARALLNRLLAREDVQAALVAQGIDPQEAQARIDSLSDAEAMDAAAQFDRLPAGSGALETLIVVAFLVFLILLILDLTGYTNVFPFVKPVK